MLKKMVVVLGMVALGFAATACGDSDSADCVGTCTEAQSRSCTTITQNCNTFCSAVLSIASKGNCGSQKDAYLGCLTSGDVCTGEARCGNQEGAFYLCSGVYCLSNPSDPDCAAIQ